LGNKLRAEINNELGEIARLSKMIEAFGDEHHLPPAAIYHITLAFDEYLTNIILYGFTDGGLHRITTSIELDGDTLAAEIVDDGIEFDPLSRAVPDTTQPLEERKIGGLGIHFIRTFMDHVEYSRANGQNHLRLCKKIPASPTN
jgi:serine/threonine-protein kinase RsbW